MKIKFKVNPWVFLPSAGLILLFVLTGAFFSGPMERFFDKLQNLIIDTFGWLYVISVAFFLLFVIWLAFFSRFAHIRLGKDDDRPEFGTLTWFAMLFSAGMGIGLIFYGVAEPILHFGAPPFAEPRSVTAAQEALNLTFFHWGFHAWSIYIVVGLSLAYYTYRHDLPLTIRSTLYPLLGERIHGPLGNLVDILAVFGTLFGLATSLGLGVLQINSGLKHLEIISVSPFNQIILIVAISLVAVISVISGLNKGVRIISEVNMGLAGVLLAFIFVAGPTVFLINTFVQSSGQYISNLVHMTFRTDAFEGLEWQKNWTMFYWGWWISWSPFVGMFFARVSRGRTIREFVVGVLLAPTVLTFLWMTIFGATAIHFDRLTEGTIVSAVSENVATGVFVVLKELPFSALATVLTTIVVAVFFITSSASGSLVLDILSAGGAPDTPAIQRVFWTLLVGAVAAILLLVGGLKALQTAAVTTALPFTCIMILICVAVWKGLSAEKIADTSLDQWDSDAQTSQAASSALRVPAAAASPKGAYLATPPDFMKEQSNEADWRERLRKITAEPEPSYSHAVQGLEEANRVLREFIDEEVMPAFEEIKVELENHGRTVTIVRDDERAQLNVFYNEAEEFTYAIEGHARERAVYAWPKFDTKRGIVAATADVVLRSGKQTEYDVPSFTREQIIENFIDAYSKWMGW